MIVVCTQRVKPVPSEEDGVILPCAVVVGIQAVCEVELLTVVLVLLKGHTLGGMIAVWRAERILVGNLLHRAVLGDYLAVVAEMVFRIVVERQFFRL